MGGRALHREPFDLWEVIALGKEKIFFISLFDKRVSNENISPGARHVNNRGKKRKRKRKLGGGLLQSLNYLMSAVH